MARLNERWELRSGFGDDLVIVWGARPSISDVPVVEPRLDGSDEVALLNRVLRIRWRDDLSVNASLTDDLGRKWVVTRVLEVGRRRFLDIAISHIARSGAIAVSGGKTFVPQRYWSLVFQERHPLTGVRIRQDVEAVTTIGMSVIGASPNQVAWLFLPEDPLAPGYYASGNVGPFGNFRGANPSFADPVLPPLCVYDSAGGRYWDITSPAIHREVSASGDGILGWIDTSSDGSPWNRVLAGLPVDIPPGEPVFPTGGSAESRGFELEVVSADTAALARRVG